MTKKITKRDVLCALRYYVEEDEINVPVNDVTVTTDDILDYIDTTLEQLDKKNEKAKERNAKKKEESDAIVEAIAELLNETPQTTPEILEKLGMEDLTPAKVSARITKLVKTGRAYKSKVKVGDRTLMGYSNVPPVVEDTED